MKRIFISVLLFAFFNSVYAQNKGKLTVVKDPLIDSLIAKRIALSVKKPTTTQPSSGVGVSQMGYRVQIYYGIDRRITFSEQAKFKTLFPRLNTYITYKEPNYYLRIGDFRTRLEAQRMLNELRPSFPTLFIFREKINAPLLDATNR